MRPVGRVFLVLTSLAARGSAQRELPEVDLPDWQFYWAAPTV
jgi:hypothetical protein